MTKRVRLFYILSLVCILQYIITTAILFYFYEGASRYNLNHSSYLFFENFLSDLGRTTKFTGGHSSTGIFYAATLSLVGLGTAFFFMFLKTIFSSYKFSKYGFIGVISGICILLVGVFPVDTNRTPHLVFLGIGYLLFFVTLLGYNIAMFKERERLGIVLYLVTILNVALLVYIFILIFGGDPQKTPSSLSLQVIAQKIIVYGQLIILGISLVLFKKKFYSRVITK